MAATRADPDLLERMARGMEAAARGVEEQSREREASTKRLAGLAERMLGEQVQRLKPGWRRKAHGPPRAPPRVLLRNREQLLANAAEGLVEARADALAILERAVDAVEPEALLRRALRVHEGMLSVAGDPDVLGPGSDEPVRVALRSIEAVRCIAAGKAAEGLLRGFAAAVPRIEEAFAAAPAPTGREGRFDVLRGGHPLPDEGSVAAGERALAAARATGPRDLLVLLLNGGGSACLEAPLVPLEDLRAVTQAMLDAGADTGALNLVRGKLSAVKAGKLAAASRGQVLALILSDVPEDPARLVASGPAAPDAATRADALAALRALRVEPPASVRALLEKPETGEAVRPGDPALARTTCVVVGSNATAARAGADMAAELGYNAFRVREPLRGSAQRAGWKLARMAEDVANGKAPLPRPACVVLGGETSVDVRGAADPGEGGRNQEVCLAAMARLRVEATLACLGTDGIDGPTPAAGAIMDMGSRERALAMGLDLDAALRRHDSHGFFRALGDALVTGPTGTNVADLAVLLVP